MINLAGGNTGIPAGIYFVNVLIPDIGAVYSAAVRIVQPCVAVEIYHRMTRIDKSLCVDRFGRPVKNDDIAGNAGGYALVPVVEHTGGHAL